MANKIYSMDIWRGQNQRQCMKYQAYSLEYVVFNNY